MKRSRTWSSACSSGSRTFPAQDLADVVAQAYQQFTDAKVRDFVPVLVEHEAVNELKRTSRRRIHQH